MRGFARGLGIVLLVILALVVLRLVLFLIGMSAMSSDAEGAAHGPVSQPAASRASA